MSGARVLVVILQKYKTKAPGFSCGMKPTTESQSTFDSRRGFSTAQIASPPSIRLAIAALPRQPVLLLDPFQLLVLLVVHLDVELVCLAHP
jgi:hypothetical protein